MALDLRRLPRDFLTEFIALYKSFPCVWRVKSADYTNRSIKAAAYEQLVLKLQEKEPYATKESVVRTINSFRGSFRKESKKAKVAQRLGVNLDEPYKPNLWYYDQLLFLIDQNTPDDTIDLIPNEDENSSTDEAGLCSMVSEPPVRPPPPPKRKMVERSSRPSSDHVLDMVANKLKKVCAGQHEAFGQYIISELGNVPLPQLVYCKKLITDVIFAAQLETLNSHSKVVTTIEGSPLMDAQQQTAYVDMDEEGNMQRYASSN